MRETPTSSNHDSHCIRVQKVYDWVVKQAHFQLYVKAENIEWVCLNNVNDFSQLGQDVDITCFITDENGNGRDPLGEHSILCEEIPQVGGRKDVTATFPNGSRVTLQKVKLFKRGYLVVEAIDRRGNSCKSEPISFQFEEAFLLCAPPGTIVDCHISYFDCTASIQWDSNKKLQNISIAIDLCQEVQMEAMAKILLKGELKIVKKELIEKEIIKKEEEEEEEEE